MVAITNLVNKLIGKKETKVTIVNKGQTTKPGVNPDGANRGGGMSTKEGYVDESGKVTPINEENRRKIIDNGKNRSGRGGGSSNSNSNPLNLPTPASNPLLDAIAPKPNINPITTNPNTSNPTNPQSRIDDLRAPTTPSGYYTYDSKTNTYYTSDGKATSLRSNIPKGYRDVDKYNKEVNYYNDQIDRYKKGVEKYNLKVAEDKKKYYQEIYTDPKYSGGYESANSYNPVYVTPKGQAYEVTPPGAVVLLKSTKPQAQNIMTTLSAEEKVQAKIRKFTGVSVPTPTQAYNYLFTDAEFGKPEVYKKVTVLRPLVDVPTKAGKVANEIFVEAPYKVGKTTGVKYAKLWGKSDAEAERFGMLTGGAAVLGAGYVGGSVAAAGLGINMVVSGAKSVLSSDGTFVQKTIGVAELTVGTLMASKGLGVIGGKATSEVFYILPKGKNTVQELSMVKNQVKIGEETFTQVSVRRIIKVPPVQAEKTTVIRQMFGINKRELVDLTKAKTYEVTGEFLIKDKKAIGVIARGLENSNSKSFFIGLGEEGKSLAESSNKATDYVLAKMLGENGGTRVIPKEQLEGLFSGKGVTQRVLRFNLKTGKVSSIAQKMNPQYGIGINSKSLPTEYKNIEKYIFASKSGNSMSPIASGEVERGRGILTKEIKEEAKDIIKPTDSEEMVTVYHGTVSDYANAIKKEGFKPGLISWTTNKEYAQGVGAMRTYVKTGGKFGKPEVIEMKIKKSDFIKYKTGTESKFFDEVVISSENSNAVLGVNKVESIVMQDVAPETMASINSQVASTIPKSRVVNTPKTRDPLWVNAAIPSSETKALSKSNTILASKVKDFSFVSGAELTKVKEGQVSIIKPIKSSASKSSSSFIQSESSIQSEAVANAQASKSASKMSQRMAQSELMKNISKLNRLSRLNKVPRSIKIPIKLVKSKSGLSSGDRQAYDVIVKRRGKDTILAKGLPEGLAKKAGSKELLTSLRASFELRPKGFTNMEDESYSLPTNIIKSKRNKNKFVQKLNTRFGARSETKEAQIFRKNSRDRIKWL